MSWQMGWQVFGRAPLQGVGAGAYAPAVAHAVRLSSNSSGRESVNQVGNIVAHNTLLSILVEQGVVGFTLFFVLLLTLVLSAWKLSKADRVFWLCILLTWAIGASDLSWEQRKPTWVIFGLLIAMAAAKLAPQLRPSWSYVAPGMPAEVYGRAPFSAEIPRSQGLSS
jgi:O-antigen ligase